MSDLNIEGMAIAPGVVETIISIAVSDVDGVASVGSAGGIKGVLAGGKPSTQGIEVVPTEDDQLAVTVHIEAQYGYALPEMAENIRQSVADAVLTQVGVGVSSVDVYIDGLQFTK